MARRHDCGAWRRCSARIASISCSTASSDCCRRAKSWTARRQWHGRRIPIRPRITTTAWRRKMEAAAAMKLSGATSFTLVKGWFNETILRSFEPPLEDCRCCASTAIGTSRRADCLENLYPRVALGGVVIVDDYYIWDGCARAVNEFIVGSHAAGCDSAAQPVSRRDCLPGQALSARGAVRRGHDAHRRGRHQDEPRGALSCADFETQAGFAQRCADSFDEQGETGVLRERVSRRVEANGSHGGVSVRARSSPSRAGRALCLSRRQLCKSFRG